MVGITVICENILKCVDLDLTHIYRVYFLYSVLSSGQIVQAQHQLINSGGEERATTELKYASSVSRSERRNKKSDEETQSKIK